MTGVSPTSGNVDLQTVRLPASGGLTLAADVGGPPDGPTVVLLHGGGQTRHSWDGTLRVLVGSGWRAWSVDLRGHGESDWAPDGDYSLDAFADDVLAVSAGLPGRRCSSAPRWAAWRRWSQVAESDEQGAPPGPRARRRRPPDRGRGATGSAPS